ncbi:MAG: hypothetical protein D9V47_13790 [Clostridia bacterium]|nr:MAG: hypothetical protein D9V47_13790 [Clostridia bacterium]
MADLEDRILDLDPVDLEDLAEEHPGVAEWLEALKAGEDVEGMLEDFDVDEDEVEAYIDENF